jgi:pimeloyl-ACP methyl ester carboxylesterase
MRALISPKRLLTFQASARHRKLGTWPFNLNTASRLGVGQMSSTNTQNAKDSQLMQLPDGRILGFSEYGPETGYPIVFFHGYPSSRLEVAAVSKIAHRRGLRVYGLDRPGFGLSTYAPDRKIMDWPNDVRAFAEHVGLNKFAVMGGSGGGPYALACAKGLPKEMMSVVGLLASAGPWEAGIRDIGWLAYLTHLAASYTPWTLRVLADGAVGSTGWIVTTARVQGWIDSLLEGMTKKEKEEWEKKREASGITTEEEYESKPIPQRREEVIRILMEAFRQGSQPSVHEAVLLTTDWGIKFEEVVFDPILIWHGVNDANAPIGMIRYMAERLPHAKLKEYKDVDHYQLIKFLEEILEELVTDEMLLEWKESR